MEDDKNRSASSGENQEERAEKVQQEAESSLKNEVENTESPTTEPLSEEASEEVGSDALVNEDLPESVPDSQVPDSTDPEEASQPVLEETVEETLPDNKEAEVTTDASEIEKNPEAEGSEVRSSEEVSSVDQDTAADTAEMKESVQEQSTEGQENTETSDLKDTSEAGQTDLDEDVPDQVSSDQQDTEDEEEENEYDQIDVDGFSKKELLDVLKQISKEEDFRKTDRLYKDLGARYKEIFDEERKKALDEFLAMEGNTESDFEYKEDDTDQAFDALHEQMRHKRSHFFHQLEKEREENLIRKEQILDMIREIVDGEDQTSFNRVKKLQEEWKKVGPVPGAHNRTLWANYHALMDRFYDQRTIYFELKDLDRKKNLQAKLELCERAEALNPEKDMKGAILQLNELHEEFKHIGPVPKEDQEPLWQRFKAASDQVYEHRRVYTEHQKEEHRKNLELKQGLAEKAAEFAGFSSDRIKEWNQKTKALLALQKEWEAVGGVPREKAREVNRSFWGNFKQFFANKSTFFKSLDAEREDNLKLKKELVEKAEALRDSKEWEEAAKTLKDLQRQWRDIGPVPEKFRKSIYEEFKSHCDHFFERKRGQNAEQNEEFENNLKEKQGVLDQLEELVKADKLDLDMAYSLTERFSDIGLVPRNVVGKVLDRYDAIGKKILNSGELSEFDRREFRMHLDICKLRNSPHGNQKINRKENAIRRKITGLENDITNWRTNLDFFASSKSADKLKKDFEKKIEDAEQELESLKQQLRLMR